MRLARIFHLVPGCRELSRLCAIFVFSLSFIFEFIRLTFKNNTQLTAQRTWRQALTRFASQIAYRHRYWRSPTMIWVHKTIGRLMGRRTKLPKRTKSSPRPEWRPRPSLGAPARLKFMQPRRAFRAVSSSFWCQVTVWPGAARRPPPASVSRAGALEPRSGSRRRARRPLGMRVLHIATRVSRRLQPEPGTRAGTPTCGAARRRWPAPWRPGALSISTLALARSPVPPSQQAGQRVRKHSAPEFNWHWCVRTPRSLNLRALCITSGTRVPVTRSLAGSQRAARPTQSGRCSADNSIQLAGSRLCASRLRQSDRRA